MTESFAKKVVIVTGGAQGIGQAIVRRFAEQGATVVIADVAESNEGALYVRCDVSQPDQVATLIDQTLSAFDRIDVLVNNAGLLGGSGSFLEVSLDSWRRFLDVNLTGAFIVGQAAARAMVARGIAGKIINIGSINSFAAEPGAVPYVTSKGGLLLLTKAMAVDLAQHGILVNLVAPGPIQVDRNAALFNAEPLRMGLTKCIPLGHPGAGGDIAAAVTFLASDENRFITGASLLVDGGLTAFLRYD